MTKRLIYFPVIVVLVLLAAHALLNSLANVYAEEAYETLMEWKINANAMKSPGYQNAISRLDQAIALNPVSSYHKELRLLIEQWQIASQRKNFPDVDFSRLIEEQRVLITKRPSWPYNWVNLVIIKTMAGNFDDEYHRAYAKAQTFAPWLRDVQLELVRSGLVAWYHLAQKTQRMVSSSVELALILNPDGVLGLIKRRNMITEVCASISGQYRHIAQCEESLVL